MLETKYGLKYSMPHSVVHIVDNSMYNGELPTIIVDDPSLYATIVVSGAPMGADNEIISINRSDVLNIAYGMSTLSSGDISKYGQSVTYPSALINQNVPVKFMRVTPEDSTYAFSCLLIQWRWDGNNMHVRFKTTSSNANNGLPAGIVHSSFKNPARLNAALVRGFSSKTLQPKTDAIEDETDGTSWKQRVFMTTIAAGRGKIYNYYNYAINQTQQSKRPANTRYMFATIDTRTDQTVERFYASLINQNNGNRADAIETVNVQVGKRVKGSSILIPTINESAVKELYNDYMKQMKYMIDNDILPEQSSSMKWVKDVYATMTINIFDPIYGRYIYNGDVDVQLPYFQVDMFNLDIPKLAEANRITVILDNDEKVADYINHPTGLLNILENQTIGVTSTSDDFHVGDIFLTNATTMTLSMITTINQYTGAVTSIPISQVYTDTEKSDKDMFRAYISLGSATTISSEAAKAAIKDEVQKLIDSRKLSPRVNANNSTASLTVYYPDYVLVGYVNSTKFGIAKVTYDDLSAGSTSVTFNITNVYGTQDEIYPILVYPTSTVSFFATSSDTSSPSGIYWNASGATVIDLENVLDQDHIGVYVNGYVTDTNGNITRYSVPGDADDVNTFHIGLCPTSITITKEIVNNSYDAIIYAPAVDTPFEWSITGGTRSAESPITGYQNKDRVKLVATSGNMIPTTIFEIKDISIVDAATGSQTCSLALVSAETQQNRQIKPGTYTTEAVEYITGYTKVAATDPAPTWEASKYYKNEDGKYIVTTTEPDDWSTNYTNYYTANKSVSAGTGLKVVVTTENIRVKVPSNATPEYIQRYNISGTQGSIFRYGMDPTLIPSNYYSDSYGLNPNSELGGVPVEHGYAGFFDDDISDIELKWRYSALLVKAFKGEKPFDPRIKSPTRCTAKFLFDGGFNTIVGQTILPYMVYKPIDIINASTIYTEDEKEAILLNNDLIANIKEFEDIDVKQAMYDLMEYRCYYGIPEDKRPIGPGSGLSLHLDSGITDANTAMLINTSFTKRFSNPNASWDIGGYVSAVDGVSYTYTKWIVDHMFAHLKQYTINKPFTGKYTNISPNEYTSFFPDVDTADWEYRELLYNSGGNAWIMDVNGNLQRNSQRTLYREGDTSDLIQESNMRTLSQLVYLLQNKIDTYLLEYNDDGVLKTLKDDVDNMFTNWVGNLVQGLDITFQRDINPLDGGEIVVCYCNVTFRGLILRVPIIVNVQRRTDSE